MTKVKIIIPAINLWETYTRQAIDSLQVAMMRAAKHDIDCSILLIDNASTDATQDAASKMVGDKFEYQRNEERWGFQKSVNFGVNRAWEQEYDYALVCNNDIMVHPTFIWRLVERMGRGDAGMVTGMDMRGESTPDTFLSLNEKEKESIDEAPHPNFSAFMISRDAWEETGEFDTVFAPAYFEDNDYHYRMQLLGVPAIVYPPALFYHFGSKTQTEANENGQPMVTNIAFEKCRWNYQRKWGGLPGEEVYKRPYANPLNPVTKTKQS